MLMRIFLNIQDDMQFRKPVHHEEKCPAFCLFPSRVPELFHHFRQRWLFPRKKQRKNHKWWLWITLHKTMGTNALWTWFFFYRKSKEKSWMTNMNHSSQNSDDKWVTQWGKIFSEGPFLFSCKVYQYSNTLVIYPS